MSSSQYQNQGSDELLTGLTNSKGLGFLAWFSEVWFIIQSWILLSNVPLCALAL